MVDRIWGGGALFCFLFRLTHHVQVLETFVEADAGGEAVLDARADDDAVLLRELGAELGCSLVDHFGGDGVRRMELIIGDYYINMNELSEGIDG